MPAENERRRLAAILAADMVGYSRLVEADETGTLARQKAHRRQLIDPAIAEHGGRLVKSTGDGFLAEFPSAVDAVRCAVKIQEIVAENESEVPDDRRILYRIGVNLGDIVIDEDDIFGGGVNVAARLEALAEPGAVLISGTVHEHVAGKLDLGFENLGEQKMKNMARPVRAFRVRETLLGDTSPVAGTRPREKPSIAILPFENMSSEDEHEFFADGVTEDVITALSRFHSLFVIARNSSFTYKGRAVKVQEIGKELGVRYVTEGSVRKSGERVRVTVQLIDTETGNHIWAERYDRKLEDIFDVQDELTAAIVAALPGRIHEAEEKRVKRQPPHDMAAYDYLIAGKIHHHRVTPEDNAEALRMLRKAIELDPDFGEAYAWKACTLGQAMMFGFTKDFEAVEEEAEASVFKALSIDENDVECHRLLCEVYMEGHDLEQARTHGARAIALNPNDPRIVAQQGELLTWLGRPEEGLEWLYKAFRLDPHGMVGRAHLLGRALYGARRYREAVEAFQQIANPRYTECAMLAACYGQLGLREQAEKQAAAVLQQKPDFSIAALLALAPYAEETDRSHLAEGLREAGLPE